MPTQERKTRNTTHLKKSGEEGKGPRRRTKREPVKAAPSAASPAPEEDKYAPKTWGPASGLGGVSDLLMPSGQLALVRKPGLQQLIVEGVLHRMDNLTALVDKKFIRKGPGDKQELDVSKLLQDNEQMADILHNVDRVVCAVVVRPPVEMAPADVTRRQPGVVYVDSIEMDDKMFIFNYALGSSVDLESFRRESQAIVGGLDVVEGVEDKTE
jgi:hypothetical protein